MWNKFYNLNKFLFNAAPCVLKIYQLRLSLCCILTKKDSYHLILKLSLYGGREYVYMNIIELKINENELICLTHSP